jgi:glucose-6-phosphate 1-dehydrogenase
MRASAKARSECSCAASNSTSHPTARSRSVKAAWAVVEPILGAATPLSPYEPGTWGPPAADRLIARAGGWRAPVPTMDARR